MKFEIFSVCERAIGPQQSMSIIGIFDTIHVPAVPVVRNFSLAVRLRWEVMDEEINAFSISLIDGDGNPVTPLITGKLSPAEAGGNSALNLVINFESIQFDDYGPYELVMEIAGKRRMAAPLNVVP